MHAYFNVYKRAQEGWNNFLLRRNAVKRLNSLQWATEEQLEQLNDVCCICYEVLDRAKVTKCNHFFHSLCLRKWLYVQDKCPMCHADILPQDWLLPVLQRMAAVGWIITNIINHFMIYMLFIRLQSWQISWNHLWGIISKWRANWNAVFHTMPPFHHLKLYSHRIQSAFYHC